MKTVFENHVQATVLYPVQKQVTVSHNGHDYIKIGKSFHSLTIPERLKCGLSLVGKVAVGILFVGLPFVSASFRKSIRVLAKEATTGKEKTVHHLLERRQLRKLDKVIFEMGVWYVREPVRAANCFVKFKCEEEEIKVEFILKNDGGALLDESAFKQKLEKVKNYLKQALDKDIGHFEDYEWLVLFQHPQTLSESHGIPIGSGWSEDKRGILAKDKLFRMGFFKPAYFDDQREFVPGPFYVPLP